MGEIRIHYGAGWTAAPGWQNFDASPTVWLERLPLAGRFVKVNGRQFPKEVRFGNIVTGPLASPASASVVYASHVLEHLSYADFWRALSNTFEMLRPGGVFRMIVPDLRGRASRYLAGVEDGDPQAAARFIRETGLGRETRARRLKAVVRAWLGNSEHLWMWDEPSIAAALAKTGFVDIRRCELGDAADPAFEAVEAANRFKDFETGDIEVAMEARRPLE